MRKTLSQNEEKESEATSCIYYNLTAAYRSARGWHTKDFIEKGKNQNLHMESLRQAFNVMYSTKWKIFTNIFLSRFWHFSIYINISLSSSGNLTRLWVLVKKYIPFKRLKVACIQNYWKCFFLFSNYLIQYDKVRRAIDFYLLFYISMCLIRMVLNPCEWNSHVKMFASNFLKMFV